MVHSVSGCVHNEALYNFTFTFSFSFTLPLILERLLLLQLYHQESIYLVLVGVEVWTTGDMINVTETDTSRTLREFCEYRTNHINPYHNNDNAQLLT